jgi:hypothetical protein
MTTSSFIPGPTEAPSSAACSALLLFPAVPAAAPNPFSPAGTSSYRPLSPEKRNVSPSMPSSASFSIPFLLPLASVCDSLCLCCYGDFDTLQKAPMLLRCGHSICSNCVTVAKSKSIQELKCNICDLGTDLGKTLQYNHSWLDALKKGVL